MTVREGRNGGDAKQFKLAKKLHGRAKKTTVQIKIQQLKKKVDRGESKALS
jgi:hypothetical protein